jgi:hypothetical protein
VSARVSIQTPGRPCFQQVDIVIPIPSTNTVIVCRLLVVLRGIAGSRGPNSPLQIRASLQRAARRSPTVANLRKLAVRICEIANLPVN